MHIEARAETEAVCVALDNYDLLFDIHWRSKDFVAYRRHDRVLLRNRHLRFPIHYSPGQAGILLHIADMIASCLEIDN